MDFEEIRHLIYTAQQGQGVLISTNNPEGSKILELFRETLDSEYIHRYFYFCYTPEIDSEEKLVERLISATELEHECEDFKKQTNIGKVNVSVFFNLFVEKYERPFLLIEGLDKILFYGGEVHKRLDTEKYRNVLAKVQEGKTSRRTSLFQFYETYYGFANPVIRSYCIHREYSLIATATLGTIEHDFVFRNSRSPIWCNLVDRYI